MSAPSPRKTTFLWPAWSRIVDGRIVMKTTGYEAGNHWTGERPVGLEDDPFWSWSYTNRYLLPPIMDESFLPVLQDFWTLEIANRDSTRGTLAPPNDGNYVFRQNSSHETEVSLAALFERYGENAFISLSDVEQPDLSLKLLRRFCRGLCEVFCFRGGKCDYFAALGEDPGVLPRQLALLDKRILRRQSN